MLLGITSLGHDASVAVLEDNHIAFAGHAERYSRVKNDGMVNAALLEDALRGERPEKIFYYERPTWKAARQLRAGQWSDVWATPRLKHHLNDLGLAGIAVETVGHHHSHAAAGYFTSLFDDAAVVVVDAIGEFQTISIWHGRGPDLKCVFEERYPHSLGLLYSAFTQRIGFKPNEEEYIMMGMAALGSPIYRQAIEEEFVDRSGAFPGIAGSRGRFRLKRNVHRGVRDWRPDITNNADIAASVQQLTEDVMVDLAAAAWLLTGSRNCVLMGGVALNCVANAAVARRTPFEHFWIMPNPGDAGSALGAILASQRTHVDFPHCYLGHEIARPLDIEAALAGLLRGEVIAVAHGRAEFGPRALGNRSLLTDPRGPNAKDRVNQIKKREPFRPFAPIVMKQFADEHFQLSGPSAFMQFTSPVRRPDLFPAIAHHDGTARVQTLERDQNAAIYELLERWHAATGCPMLLNTSLNIKGEPLCNTWEDARRFSDLYRVPLY